MQAGTNLHTCLVTFQTRYKYLVYKCSIIDHTLQLELKLLTQAISSCKTHILYNGRGSLEGLSIDAAMSKGQQSRDRTPSASLVANQSRFCTFAG